MNITLWIIILICLIILTGIVVHKIQGKIEVVNIEEAEDTTKLSAASSTSISHIVSISGDTFNKIFTYANSHDKTVRDTLGLMVDSFGTNVGTTTPGKYFLHTRFEAKNVAMDRFINNKVSAYVQGVEDYRIFYSLDDAPWVLMTGREIDETVGEVQFALIDTRNTKATSTLRFSALKDGTNIAEFSINLINR